MNISFSEKLIATPKSEDLSKKSARGAIVTVSTQVVRLVINFLSVAILARLLGPEPYGIIGMSASLLIFVGLFRDLGLSTATIQRKELESAHINTLFWINLSASILLALVMIAVAPLVARFYGEPRLTSIIAVSAIVFPLGGLGVQHQAILCRQMRFSCVSAIELIAIGAGFASAVCLAIRGWGYWALVGGNIATNLFQTIGYWIACPWIPGKGVWNRDTRSMIAFGGQLTGFNSANYFSRNADNVLIGWRWGATQLGYYDRAYQLLLLPLRQINNPIASVMVPLLSRLNDQPTTYRRTYIRVVEKIALVTCPAIIGCALTADWLVQLMLGSSWAPSARIYALLAISGLFQTVGNTSGWLLMSQGRGVEMLRWGCIASMFTVVGFMVGLPWGPSGVAICYGVTTAVQMPFQVYVTTRRGPVESTDLYRVLRLPAIASFAVGISILALRVSWQPTPLLGFIVATVLGLATASLTIAAQSSGRAAILDLFRMLRATRPAA